MSSSIAPGRTETLASSPGLGAFTLDQLLAALPEKIEPVRRSWRFRLRLGIALLTLLAVLAVYVTLVVVTSYGIWSHFASDRLVSEVHRLFGDARPYIVFCVVGSILCVFLVKPIFTAFGAEDPGLTLDRATEPRLFAFVERLCQAQGAPAPRRIRVDTQVNASAGLRHGLVSLFRDDLSLTIGLPLAKAMTLRELTGVLAHEFGHFAHGGAMRLSYLIRVVIAFLIRIARERDSFDDALIDMGRFRIFLDIRITLVLFLVSLFFLGVQLFLWLARMLMSGMAYVGLAACSALLREMEYDADRHEARVAGSDVFAQIGDKLALLGAAKQATVSLLAQSWESRRLADDVPKLVSIAAGRISARPEVAKEYRETLMRSKTGWFDTHPSDRDRLASVEREAEPGAFRLDAPASILFHDLEGLCRATTVHEYKEQLGLAINGAKVLPVDELLYAIEGDTAAPERLERLTQGCPLSACRINPGHLSVLPSDDSMSPEEASRLIEANRARVANLSPSAIDAARRLGEARQRLTRLDLSAILARGRSSTGSFSADIESALDAKRQGVIEVEAINRELEVFSAALGERLLTTLRLRRAPAIAALLERASGTADPAQSEALAVTLAGLDAIREKLDYLASRLLLLLELLQYPKGHSDSHTINRRAVETGDEVRQLLKTITEALGLVPYPFPTPVNAGGRSSESGTVGALLGSSFIPINPAQVYGRGVELLAQIRNLGQRIVSSLVLAAEEIETALGLPRMTGPLGN